MTSVQESIGVSPPKMDGSNVPDLIRVGAIQSNMSMDVSSDVLDPIVCNQTNCRFVLTNKGYLHDGSRITLSVKGNASTAAGAFFPLGLGVHSLIRRATLSVGGNTISEIDDYNHYKAFESIFLSSEINKDREAYMSGRQISHDFQYNSTAGAHSDTSALTYGLGSNIEYSGGNLDVDPVLDINKAPVFSVTLAELFPFLKGTNLPLFAMKQEIVIDLVWEPQVGGRVSVNSNNTTIGSAIEIDTTEVKLVADYIFYDGELMSQQLQQYNSQPTNFAYNDYRLTKTTLSVTDAQNSVRNLGGAGRIVTRVMSFINDDNRSERFVCNKYSAVAPDKDYASGTKKNDTLTMNIRMNDFFVFPIDLSNSAVLFDKTSRAMGSLPFVTRQEYSGEGDTITSATFEANTQNSSRGIASNFFFQAYKLPAGRVNARGLELTTQLASLPALAAGKNYTQRSYIEIGRVAVLKQGFLTAGFS
tara:strand:- start:1476 stop:2897 length:1422 start_codon:yes stop_codon:yes gene_type:complete